MSSGTWWERARGEETGDEAVGMSPDWQVWCLGLADCLWVSLGLWLLSLIVFSLTVSGPWGSHRGLGGLTPFLSPQKARVVPPTT